jgi:nicotinamidase-related amidase
VPREASARAHGYFVDRLANTVIPAHQRLLAAAREHGAKVVYLVVGAEREDGSDAIRPFQEMFRINRAIIGSAACEVIPEIAPEPGDICLPKAGSGGFSTSRLDSCLRNLGIDHVLYTGVVTNACVLLTLGAGFDLGYYGYLVTDATATYSQRLQDFTEEIVCGYMALTVTTDEIIGQLAGTPALAVR